MIPALKTDKIDYDLLSEAINLYETMGWTQIEVPWIASLEAVDATQPFRSRRFAVDEGHLIGSAEQGFLELAARDMLAPGLYMAVSPCWRDERTEDRWHQRQFLKLELWDSEHTTYGAVLEDALTVMRRLAPHRKIEPFMLGNTHDIVSEESFRPPLELGSYGTRTASVYGRKITWNYGTGLALPRFSQQ